jgi:hypothetical protein
MGASASAIAATDVGVIAADLIPAISRIACKPPSFRASLRCSAHNVPVPSSESCKRKRPESAAKDRWTKDIDTEAEGSDSALTKARPSHLLRQSGEAVGAVGRSPTDFPRLELRQFRSLGAMKRHAHYLVADRALRLIQRTSDDPRTQRLASLKPPRGLTISRIRLATEARTNGTGIANHPGLRRARDDQWTALICQADPARRRTMSSAPAEFTCRPFACPWLTDVETTQAASP